MTSLLDATPEAADNAEPRVLTSDIQAMLIEIIKPDDPDNGLSVAQVAERANVSTRTVYRHLTPDKEDMSLELADKLCRACEVRMRDRVHLMWPDGSVTDYTHVPVGFVA